MHAALCCPLTPGHGPALTSRWTNRQHGRGTCTRGKDEQERLRSQGLPAHRADGSTALSTRKLFTSNCDVGHSGQATRTAGRRGSSPVPQAEAPEKRHLRNGLARAGLARTCRLGNWTCRGREAPGHWGSGTKSDRAPGWSELGRSGRHKGVGRARPSSRSCRSCQGLVGRGRFLPGATELKGAACAEGVAQYGRWRWKN